MKYLAILSLISIIALSCQDEALPSIRRSTSIIDVDPIGIESTKHTSLERLAKTFDSPRTRQRRAKDVPFISLQGTAYDKLLNDSLSTSTTATTTTTTTPTTTPPITSAAPSTVTTTTKAAKTKRKQSKKAIKNTAAYLKKKAKVTKKKN